MGNRVADFISALDSSKAYDITIAQHREKRTKSQNALMWVWIGEVVDHVIDHTGMDSDEVHDFFKRKFLTPKISEIGNEIHEHYSTKKLSIEDMSRYMNKIHAFGTVELGLRLRDPGDLGKD